MNQMKHLKSVLHFRRKWLLFLYVMFARVKSEDQPGGPTAGMLCISDCATCPMICSPPPPAVKSKPPPTPSPQSQPPPSPPAPVHHYSPPQWYYFPSPPPSLLPSKPPAPPAPSPPPPSSISWGAAAPPPPSFGYMPSIQAPPGMGQRNYSYPYYYFYASKASCFTLQGSSSLMIILLSFLVFYFS